MTLTQRLLAFARKQVLQPRSVDLRRLVEGMQELLVRTLGENVRLVVDADRALWPTLVDPNQMELVILNLAINARDAMPGGGTLSITASNRESDRDAPPELSPGQYVVLTVSDTGVGMDAADPGAGDRTVLHHQGSGQGHRSRAGHDAGRRRPIRRRHAAAEHTRASAPTSRCGCSVPDCRPQRAVAEDRMHVRGTDRRNDPCVR